MGFEIKGESNPAQYGAVNENDSQSKFQEGQRTVISQKLQIITPDGRQLNLKVRVYSERALNELTGSNKETLEATLAQKVEHVTRFITTGGKLDSKRGVFFDFFGSGVRSGECRGIKVKERSSGDHVAYQWKAKHEDSKNGKAIAQAIDKVVAEYDKVNGFQPNSAGKGKEADRSRENAEPQMEHIEGEGKGKERSKLPVEEDLGIFAKSSVEAPKVILERIQERPNAEEVAKPKPIPLVTTMDHRERTEELLQAFLTLDTSKGAADFLNNSLLYGYKGSKISSLALMESINQLMMGSTIPVNKKELLSDFVVKWLESGSYQKDLSNKEVRSTIGSIQTASYPPSDTSPKLLANAKIIQKQLASPFYVRTEAQKSDSTSPTVADLLNEAKKSSKPNPKLVKDLADELITTFMEDLSNIDINQVVNNKASNPEISPDIASFTTKYSNLGPWIAKAVLSSNDAAERKALMMLMIGVIKEVNSKGAFPLGQAIYNGLNHGGISRLEQKLISMGVYEWKDKEIKAEMKALSILFDPKGNELKKAIDGFKGEFQMPDLLPLLKGKDGAMEVNPDVRNGELNIDRLEIMSKILKPFAQQVEVLRQHVPTRTHSLNLGDALDRNVDDDVYTRSTQIKPRVPKK